MATSFFCVPWVLGRAARALSLPRHVLISSLGTLIVSATALPSTLSVCHLAEVLKGCADELHNGVVDKDIVNEMKRILEMAERCMISVGHVETLTCEPDVVAVLRLEVFESPAQRYPYALEIEPPRRQSFNSVVASLRVNALASAGFKISRTKLAALIRLEK